MNTSIPFDPNIALAKELSVIEIMDNYSGPSELPNPSGKGVHFLGYCYDSYNGCDSNDTTFRILEYTFFIRSLADVLAYGNINGFESTMSENYKQYLTDVTCEQALDAYQHWDNGNPPRFIREEDINENTPTGIYCVIRKQN